MSDSHTHLGWEKLTNSTADLQCIQCYVVDMTLDTPKISCTDSSTANDTSSLSTAQMQRTPAHLGPECAGDRVLVEPRSAQPLPLGGHQPQGHRLPVHRARHQASPLEIRRGKQRVIEIGC